MRSGWKIAGVVCGNRVVWYRESHKRTGTFCMFLLLKQGGNYIACVPRFRCDITVVSAST